MRRTLALILALVMVATLFAACAKSAEPSEVSGPGGTTEGTKSSGSGAKKEIVEIAIEASESCYAEAIQDSCDQAFLDELGVKLALTMVGPTDSYAKTMMEFSQGTSKSDIVLFQPAWLGDYAPHLEPLVPLCEKYGVELFFDDIMPKFKNIYCSWQGVQYAIPFDGDQFNLFYNTQAFEDAKNKADFKAEYGYDLNPPRTWEEYADMANFFNGRDWDNDGEPEYGTSEAWLSGGYAYWWWMAKFAAYGGMYFDEDMNPLINSQNGKDALAITMKIAKAVPPGTTSYGYSECLAAFANGDAPMCVCWNSVGKSSMNPDQSKIVGKVGIAMVPGAMVNGQFVQRPILPTGWAAGIPKYIPDEKKELALKVIEHFSKPEIALDLALYHPSDVDAWRISTFESEIWNTRFADVGDADFGKEAIKVMKETVEKGLVDLQIPGTDEYIQALDKEISAAITGTKDPNKALDDAAKEWNAITDRRDREAQKAAWKSQYDAIKADGIQFIPYK